MILKTELVKGAQTLPGPRQHECNETGCPGCHYHWDQWGALVVAGNAKPFSLYLRTLMQIGFTLQSHIAKSILLYNVICNSFYSPSIKITSDHTLKDYKRWKKQLTLRLFLPFSFS